MEGLTSVGTGGARGYYPQRSSSDPTVFPKQSAKAEAKAYPQPETPDLEQARFEAVRKVAERSFPPANQRFTIYKDKSGEFITVVRNTSTGEVTQIPEPKMLEQLAVATTNPSSHTGLLHTIA
ncbi:MAG: hypothetical protein H6908_01490 [Hyphomicrobiales bacterium]|nr:hypothetical protein [Hyphomicrobiales bacterium]